MFTFVLVNCANNLYSLDASYLPYFAIYMTNQGLMLLLAEQTLGFILVTYAYKRQSESSFDIAR